MDREIPSNLPKARPYQEELLNTAKEKNSLICLGTGAGKTYIAIMVICHHSHELEPPYDGGGKRTFFLVPTRPLVKQQASEIVKKSRFTENEVGEYTGDMNVDYWSKSDWLEHLRAKKIFVMTRQIFLNMLNSGVLPLNKVNLLVFDEAHHAAPKEKKNQQTNDVYRLIMEYIQLRPQSEHPRILGLSASLINAKSVVSLPQTIADLEAMYQSTCTSVADLGDVRKYATDPVESICEYDEAAIDFQCNNAKELLAKALRIFYDMEAKKKSLDKENRRRRADDQNENKETVTVNLPIGIDAFQKCDSIISLIFDTMGPWCALEACDFYIKEFQTYIELYEHSYPAFCSIITTVNDMLKTVDGLIKYELHLQRPSLSDLLLRFCSNQMKELLKLLTEYSDPSRNLAGIIFVERRAICKVLSKWLQKVKEVDVAFDFLNPDYIVGEAARPGFANKIAVKAAKMQKDTLNKFRKSDINLLVATSILEEGLDVSQCNLVVRYDGCSTFRAWIQSQGRARSKDGRFVVFSKRETVKETRRDLSKFKHLSDEMQAIATSKTRTFRPSTSMTKSIPEDEMPLVNHITGARVTLDSAKTIVFMYCSRLPSDAFFSASPYETLIESADGLQVVIRLPINSPLNQGIKGPVKQTESMATNSAYLEVCRQLREKDEIDESFVPYNKKVRLQKIIEEFNLTCSLDDEEMQNDDGPKPGTVKRRQIYSKSLEGMFADLPIKSSEPMCIYSIKVEPRAGGTSIGFICSQQVAFSNIVASFPVYIKTNEFKVSITAVSPKFNLSSRQLYQVQLFHQVVFHESLGFKRKHLTFDDSSPVYVVPLSDTFDVDWEMIQQTLDRNDSNKMSSNEERQEFKFNESDYTDAMVYRRYEPIGLFEVIKIDTKTPSSRFPSNSDGYKTYTEYFAAKYGLTVTHTTFPLLSVDSIGFNSSISRLEPTEARRKREMIHLVPEFLLIFPIPTSFHRQCRLLPAIFYRLCQLYHVEQLRENIAGEANFGWKPLSTDHSWGPLDFGCEKSNYRNVENVQMKHQDDNLTEGSDTDSSDGNNEQLASLAKDLNEMEVDNVQLVSLPTPKDVFSEFYGDTNELQRKYSNFNVSAYTDKMKAKLDQCYDELMQAPAFNYDVGDHSQYLPGKSGIRMESYVDFDRVKSFDRHTAAVNESNIVGPTPSLLLQALTTRNARDMFDMERLETLGDSFLKLTTSAYFYYELPVLNEGYLSLLKVSQISNRNLYGLGKKKNLAEYIVAQQFQPSNRWLPPGFSAVDMDEDVVEKKLKYDGQTYDKYTKQKISDKSVADCLEALIGAYLLSSGPKGAVKFMTWLGIRIMDPMSTENVDHWLPSPRSSQPAYSSTDNEVKIRNLSTTLNAFEEYIGYKFRDKCFLIQALTHVSYHDNTVTDCYQRLEFLGDAVLDYLITRYIYEDPKQFTPGDLTALRAALTNNAFFGSLAVKHKFHVHLKMNSYDLYRSIYTFADKHKMNPNDVVYGNFMTLIEEHEASSLDETDIPKALGDVFESVAGAIYLDSNYSLDAVWRVYYPLMEMELAEFSKNIPKSPLSLLYNNFPKSVIFSIAETVKRNEVSVTVTVKSSKGGTITENGVGKNRYWAKNSAAKRVLKRKM